VLSCEKSSNSEVASQQTITGEAVGKWRQRFIKSHLDTLLDEPRADAPRQIKDRQVEELRVSLSYRHIEREILIKQTWGLGS